MRRITISGLLGLVTLLAAPATAQQHSASNATTLVDSCKAVGNNNHVTCIVQNNLGPEVLRQLRGPASQRQINTEILKTVKRIEQKQGTEEVEQLKAELTQWVIRAKALEAMATGPDQAEVARLLQQGDLAAAEQALVEQRVRQSRSAEPRPSGAPPIANGPVSSPVPSGVARPSSSNSEAFGAAPSRSSLAPSSACTGLKRWFEVSAVSAKRRHDGMYQVEVRFLNIGVAPAVLSLLTGSIVDNIGYAGRLRYPSIRAVGTPFRKDDPKRYLDGVSWTSSEPGSVTFHAGPISRMNATSLTLKASLVVAIESADGTAKADETELSCVDLPISE